MPKCPTCRSESNHKHGIDRQGHQCYMCKFCGRRFKEAKDKVLPDNTRMKCPYCGGHSLRNGKSSNGSQKMKCVVCNKFFIDGEKVTKYMATTNETKSKIAFYLFTGAMNNRMIADMFGVSRNTVIGVKKKLKIQMENNAAKIAAEQAKVFRTLNMYAEDEAEDAKLQSKELKRMRRKHATNNINE